MVTRVDVKRRVRKGLVERCDELRIGNFWVILWNFNIFPALPIIFFFFGRGGFFFLLFLLGTFFNFIFLFAFPDTGGGRTGRAGR